VLIPRVYNFLKEITNTFEIIIVEDGSPDKTGEVADELARKFSNVRVIHHEKNQGYGAALRTGFLSAKYDYILYTDGDIQYDIYEFKQYLYLLKEYDILNGYVSRKAVTLRRKIQSSVFNILVDILFFKSFKDVNCSIKMYKKEVIDKMDIKCKSGFIDAEMLIKAEQLGFSRIDVPVTHYERNSGLGRISSTDGFFLSSNVFEGLDNMAERNEFISLPSGKIIFPWNALAFAVPSTSSKISPPRIANPVGVIALPVGVLPVVARNAPPGPPPTMSSKQYKCFKLLQSCICPLVHVIAICAELPYTAIPASLPQFEQKPAS